MYPLLHVGDRVKINKNAFECFSPAPLDETKACSETCKVRHTELIVPEGPEEAYQGIAVDGPLRDYSFDNSCFDLVEPAPLDVPLSPVSGAMYTACIQQLECPKCRSRKGMYCRTPSGKKATPPHGDRVQAYMKSVSRPTLKNRHAIKR